MITLEWLEFISPSQKEQLLHIFLSAFLPQHRHTSEQLTDYFNNKIKPRLKPGELICIALDRKRIIGFIIFEAWEKHSYYLAEMAILPECQRKGVGKQLVFSIFHKKSDAKQILLVTEKENSQSQSFYKKIGFKHSTFQHPDYPEHFIAFEFNGTRDFGGRL